MKIEKYFMQMEENYKVLNEQLQMLDKKIENGLQPKQEPDEILDVYGVMELTHLAKQTIYCLKNDGKIPFFKFGGRLLRFHKNEIIAWMLNRHEFKN